MVGSILIILLTAFLGVEQHVAQATNIFFFIPTAIISIIVHFKNKNVDSNVGRNVLLPVIVGSFSRSSLGVATSTTKIKKIFRNIFTSSWNTRNDNNNQKNNKKSKGECKMKKLMTGMVIGAVIGGMVGSMASDDIYDFKKKMMKKGKKIAKMF